MLFTVKESKREVKINRKAEKELEKQTNEVFRVLKSTSEEDSADVVELLNTSTKIALRRLQEEIAEWGF
jgi:nitrate reductase assembly molybdenum cofactor insertion protein NarJ